MRMVGGVGKNRGEGEKSAAAAGRGEMTQAVGRLVMELLDGLQLGSSDEGDLEHTGEGGASLSSR